MSPSGNDIAGDAKQTEVMRARLLDRATNIMQRPDFSGYNADVNRVSLEDNAMRSKVVGELLKDKEGLPTHLQEPSTLDAHLLESHLSSQREALAAQKETLKNAGQAKETWMGSAMTKVKNGFSAAGSHLYKHKWKYLALAGAAGAGWYFSGYITPWLQQLRSAVTQGAVDTAAATGINAAPNLTPALEGVSEGGLLGGQALHELPYAADASNIAPRALIQQVAPAITPNGISSGKEVLNAFPK